MRLFRALALVLVVLISACADRAFAQEAQAKPAADAAAAAAARVARLKLMRDVKSWGYQLRQINISQIAQSPLDLVVIDHALSVKMRFAHEFDIDKVASLKVKPNGTRRVVLAYMSIGEAEVYRFYWRPEWNDPARRPSWILDENAQWRGNFRVRFWDPEWQAIIHGSPEAYLDRLIDAGFDGVYIDRADVFEELGRVNPAAEAEMAAFIVRLAAYARARNPSFVLVMQNAEELIDYQAVLSAIDAIAKEDLFFGINHDALPNEADTVSWTIDVLRKARRAGRPVLVVEYLDDAVKAREARRRATAERFVIHFAPRDLGELRPVGPDEAAAAVPVPGPPPAATQP